MDQVMGSSQPPVVAKSCSTMPALLAFVGGAVVATVILVVCLVIPVSRIAIPFDSGVRHVAVAKPTGSVSASSTAELLSEIDHLKGRVNYYTFKEVARNDAVDSVYPDPFNSNIIYYVIRRNLNGSMPSLSYDDKVTDHIVSIKKIDMSLYDPMVGTGSIESKSITLFTKKLQSDQLIRFAKEISNNQIVFFVDGRDNSPGPCFQLVTTDVDFLKVINTHDENQTALRYTPTALDIAKAKADEAKCMEELGVN